MPPAHDTFALPAIELPQRCRDGLGADAARQLCLRIGASAAFAPGDLIEVFIDERFATAVIIKPKQVGLPLVLNVSQAILNSGMVKLRYQVLRAGQYSHASPVTVVYAKLECPGGAPLYEGEVENQFLPPLCFPKAMNLRQIRRQGGLPFYLPAYEHMAAGDEITVRWGDERFDLPPLLPRQVGLPVHGCIPLVMLARARPGHWRELTWSVRDRVGNHSRWAPCQSLGLPEEV